MPVARYLSKEEILHAMRHTKSIASAARFLGCSLNHIKRYMREYIDEETGKSLLEVHKNWGAKGVRRAPQHMNGVLEKIMMGEVDARKYPTWKLKEMLIIGGYTHERCFHCGFNEKRSIDGKMPLMLHFLDNNPRNWVGGNVQLVCYNCYFLRTANMFTENEMNDFEGHEERFKPEKKAEKLDMDRYTLDRLREFDTFTPQINTDPYSLVSRRK